MPRAPVVISILAAFGAAVAGGAAAQAAKTGEATGTVPPSPLRTDLSAPPSTFDPELLYQGWRARLLLGQPVAAKSDGRGLGTVRDIIVDKDGRAAALVVEGGGPADLPAALYRVPWSNVDTTPGKAGVSVDLSNAGERPQYGLFPGSEGVATLPREFRVSELLGDYARLQTGYGYGVVTDAVFTPDGRLAAVLVSRDAAAGGGTAAFPFPGTAGPWDPGLSYYGLPFVTEGQARAVALTVDPTRFKAVSL
jgi:sporulation protein YlmC with PRC-barrel domain